MASNFQILSYKTKNSLHLKLDGDFDGNSAHELINAIIDHGANFYQVFIDTNDLRTIHAFGRNVFQKNFGVLKQLSNLVFIGENERQLSQN
jgi:hypothetical protein